MNSIGGRQVNEAAADFDSKEVERSSIEFRALTFQHKRHAFKLESIFWRVLEAAANANSMSLAQFISNVVSAPCDRSNKASMLRVAAAQWLMSRLLAVSEKSMSQKTVARVIKTSPVPAFIVSNTQAIEAPNEAFMRMLDGFEDEGLGSARSDISLRFRSDVASLLQRCKSNAAGYLVDELVFQVGQQRRILRARIAAIESINAQPLGFVVYIADEKAPR